MSAHLMAWQRIRPGHHPTPLDRGVADVPPIMSHRVRQSWGAPRETKKKITVIIILPPLMTCGADGQAERRAALYRWGYELPSHTQYNA